MPNKPACKIRFNLATTVDDINAPLDAIAANYAIDKARFNLP